MAIFILLQRDFRQFDNPAMAQAVAMANATQQPLYAIYILDQQNPLGSAQAVWLHHILKAFQQKIRLNIFKGDILSNIKQLLTQYPQSHIFYNQLFEPHYQYIHQQLPALCAQYQSFCHDYNGNYLWHPTHIVKDDGTAYKIYSAFARATAKIPAPAQPGPDIIYKQWQTLPGGLEIQQLSLLPGHQWWQKIPQHWAIDSDPRHQFDQFWQNNQDNYANGRDYPAQNATSHLSPFLHFGQISPHYIWHKLQNMQNTNPQKFLSELLWREFNNYLLYNFPTLPEQVWNKKFATMPWHNDKNLLQQWQNGQTGIPIIDAGMAELWQTGFMANRVRMLCASFLCKNCLVDWRLGQAWFFDCLVDADLANNAANWQWVAGSGADAAPYFRIFNPAGQSEKYDKDGLYIKKYLPHLAPIPAPAIHAPWQYKDLWERHGIIIGRDYPKASIDLSTSRARALEIFQYIK